MGATREWVALLFKNLVALLDRQSSTQYAQHYIGQVIGNKEVKITVVLLLGIMLVSGLACRVDVERRN